MFPGLPSVEASYEDHAEFLDRQPRYDSLFCYAATDYRSWARGLKAAGYATAPDYALRLVRIIENNRLYLFDREGASGSMPRPPKERAVSPPRAASANRLSRPEGSTPTTTA